MSFQSFKIKVGVKLDRTQVLSNQLFERIDVIQIEKHWNTTTCPTLYELKTMIDWFQIYSQTNSFLSSVYAN